ncbi:MAG: HD domain-containing protein [Spirochaetaceae bacterium]|jgi:poly(A) polymerase|nr:HD domain-containing protein [Spirochaetaceae bacterium]
MSSLDTAYRDMGHHDTLYQTLAAHRYSLRFCSFSALDRYWGLPPLPFVWAETDADIPGLARLFEELRFPGVDLADGAVERERRQWYFRCPDPDEESRWPSPDGPSYKILTLTQDQTTRIFYDPLGVYPLLRLLRDGKPPTAYPPDMPPLMAADSWRAGGNPEIGRWRAVMDGALILARYTRTQEPLLEGRRRSIVEPLASLQGLANGQPPSAEGRRVLLTSLLVSRRPDLGLELLKTAGFVEEFWPELARLTKVDHTKEFHPEGNVWDHTLETFRYRKAASWDQEAAAQPGGTRRGAALPTYELRLSLGLLLHDVGKPLAAASGRRRFDGHAELGAREARRFLERMEFEPSLISDVCYLVKNHMLPAALPRLPLSRTEEIMESPLFSTLMELYRCDESSSFKGMDAYYKSSAVYQTYLRRRHNPYRSADGKILGRGKI